MMNFPHSSLPKLSPIFLERIPLKSLASSAIKAGRITQDRAVIYIIYTCLLSGITLFIKKCWQGSHIHSTASNR